jgi:2-methylcitrate dehydratase PrpD
VKFHQARGALSGLLAALVAAEGFDGGASFLTAADGGFLSTYSDGGDPSRITDGLGETWELMGISLRRWPTASALQAVVQAALELRERAALDPASLERVRVELPMTAYRLNGGREWHDQLSAFQSAAYVAAVVLLDGRCWLEQFSPERIQRPDIAAFVRERVEVAADPSLPASGARVTLTTNAGPPLAATIAVPRGDPAAPLSLDDLRDKLAAATAGTSLEPRTGRIVELVLGLDTARSIEPLLAALRADDGQAGERTGPLPLR